MIQVKCKTLMVKKVFVHKEKMIDRNVKLIIINNENMGVNRLRYVNIINC